MLSNMVYLYKCHITLNKLFLTQKGVSHLTRNERNTQLSGRTLLLMFNCNIDVGSLLISFFFLAF